MAGLDYRVVIIWLFEVGSGLEFSDVSDRRFGHWTFI